MGLDKCLNFLKNKNPNFNDIIIRNKINNRFILCFVIDFPKFGNYEFGFDNHNNHQRPHIHVKKNRSKFSFSVDCGELMHEIKNKKGRLASREKTEIKNWIIERKECLEFIYKNIQNCHTKDDFAEIIKEL
jgi:hypothetical protein